MAGRIKVINDPGELVSIFHASDSDVKRKLLIDLSTSWMVLLKFFQFWRNYKLTVRFS